MKLKSFPAKPRISPLLLRFLVIRSDGRGFTLLELLIAMVIASIIVSTLLYGVVNILQTDQRDASRSDTQRDMQMAMDYIARDVREATYVYGVTQDTTINPDGTTSLGPKQSCLYDYGAASLKRGTDGKCTGLLNYLPKFLTTGQNRPVLAFWKAESLPSTMQASCKTKAVDVGKTSGDTGFSAVLNSTPCVAQRMYTLVVYSIDTEPASIWRGKARIRRYQLPHFTETAAIGAITPGWVAPIAKDKRPRTWPIGNGTAINGDPVPNGDLQFGVKPIAEGNLNQVLTDFVDNDATKVGLYKPGYCPNGFDAPNGFTDLVPNPAFNPVFYVCVRSDSLTAAKGTGTTLADEAAKAAGQGINPEVHIVLKGNAAGRGGIPLLTGEVPFQMETRVLSRGAFGKLSNNN